MAALWFQCSDKSCLRTPSMKKRPTDASAEGKKDTGMLKYIRNQVPPPPIPLRNTPPVDPHYFTPLTQCHNLFCSLTRSTKVRIHS